MTDLTFYDAAVPPANPPKTDGVAFYIGGDTPHIWSLAEIKATTARYRLPIFVRSDPPAHQAAADAAAAVSRLAFIGAPKGSLVAWDTEVAADPVYIGQVFRLLSAAGYKLLDYGSQSVVFENDVPDGYYWGADWTGTPHIHQGDAGTQYEAGTSYDLNIFKPGLPFWDTHHGGTTPPPPVNWQEHMMQQLPVVQQGAIGNFVRTIQCLCAARGHVTRDDGVFGIDTGAAVRSVQADAQIKIDGIVGPQTWPALLGIA